MMITRTRAVIACQSARSTVQSVPMAPIGGGGMGNGVEWTAMRTGSSELALDLDRGSIVPIYRQIYERLREQILAGALPEGARVPPATAFAAGPDVNRSTVVHAYRDLAADGLISQRVGSGSRVAGVGGGGPGRGSRGAWWGAV